MSFPIKAESTGLIVEQSVFQKGHIRIRYTDPNSPNCGHLTVYKQHINALIGTLMKAKRELGMAPSTCFEEQKQTILVKRVTEAGDPWSKWRAWVREDTGRFGEGKTRDEAIGALITNYPSKFNVEVPYQAQGIDPGSEMASITTTTATKAAPALGEPIVTLVPQVGMMVQYHEPLYDGSGINQPIAAMIVGRAADPFLLSLKLFPVDGQERVVHNVRRGGADQSFTWEFMPAVLRDVPLIPPKPAVETTGFGQHLIDAIANYGSARMEAINEMRRDGHGDWADRLEKSDACGNPKIVAFPCDDVTIEVDEDGYFYISDHEQVVAIDKEDVRPVIDALNQLRRTVQASA